MAWEERKRRKRLERALRSAPSYERWNVTAKALDALDGNDAWREEDESAYFDSDLLRRHIGELEALRSVGDISALEATVTESLYRTLPDISAPPLYERTHVGESKIIVGEYLDEAERALTFLAEADVPGFTKAVKRERFERAYRNLGRYTLMLSGGAAWGLYHLGVVKALLTQGLLPTVICGSSMGAIVASGIGTRTDEELRTFFAKPETIHRRAVAVNAIGALMRGGSVLKLEQLEEHIHENVGAWTFQEAFERTGRVLNVSVSPTRARQKPRVLSHLTSPHVLVADATVASCAIPGFWPAVRLRAKNPRTGELFDYVPTEKWVDGSMRSDLPLRRVGRLYNVNHFIVSQANPFVVPFAGRNSHSFAQSAARFGGSIVRAQAAAVLDETRRRVHSDLIRPWLDTAHAIADQNYGGDITIHPPVTPRMYAKVMQNPSEDQLRAYIHGGQRATWPQLAVIRDQTRIARVLEHCIRKLS